MDGNMRKNHNLIQCLSINNTANLLAIVYVIGFCVSACDLIKPAISKLVSAIPDIDPSHIKDTLDKSKDEVLCDLYIQRATGFAEHAWANDWWRLELNLRKAQKDIARDPVADLDMCFQSFAALAVPVHGKDLVPGLQAHMPENFKDRDIKEQSAMCWGKLAKLLWVKRVGVQMALIDFASVSGRMGSQATSKAVEDHLLLEYGVDARVRAEQRRIEGINFPGKFKAGRILTNECSYRFFEGVRTEFQRRLGEPTCQTNLESKK